MTRILSPSVLLAARMAFSTLAMAPVASQAAILFDDVTNGSGLEYTGESYGGAWGDYNSDGLPDIFVTHHRAPAGLYVNRGNGTFEDRAFEVDYLFTNPISDQHGAAWGDFDNDGDNDLFVAVGSVGDSEFYVHDGSTLVFSTHDYTFDKRSWGGRMPVWLDFSRDGLLDFAIALQGDKFHLYRQEGNDFIRVNHIYTNDCFNNDFGQLADVTGDDVMDWICVAQLQSPDRIYDFSGAPPFEDETSLIPPVSLAIDTAFADFNNDLKSDLLVARGKERASGAQKDGTNKIEASLIDTGGSQTGLSFQTAGDVTFKLFWGSRSVANVFIGATGQHPPQPGGSQHAPLLFTLSPGDPSVVGMMPLNSNPGKESIYIGYDPTTQTWTMWNVSNTWSYIYGFLDSTQPVVGQPSIMPVLAVDGPLPPAYLQTQSGAYVTKSNFGMPPQSCISLAAADFDNNMTLDAYFVCRGAVDNLPNKLFSGNGDGSFTEVTTNHGARGPTGLGVGLGENVVAADYDVDGRVDLFVTNGLGLVPVQAFTTGGPDKLFRNVSTGSNNWIELDLVGVTSNRDGIGARVIATTPDSRQQLREQGGGYHRWAQHHPRIHFGLGPNPDVDLQVTWPDGTQDTYTDVEANKLYRLTQGDPVPVVITVPTEVEPSPCGTAGGLPQYSAGTEKGVFMGIDCATGRWKVRVATDASGWTVFQGQVTADQPFDNVTGFSLEASDTLDTSDPDLIAYSLGVGGSGDDGFDFGLAPGSSACFNLSSPLGEQVLVGSGRTPVSVPFDLETLSPCEPTGPPLCGLPSYNSGTEQAVFLGQDCATGAWQFRATAGGSGTTYRGSLISSQAYGSVSGFSLEANDTLDATSDPAEIAYILNMGGAGQDGFDFTPAAGAPVCVGVDTPPGVPVFVGSDRRAATAPFDLETLGPCTNVLPALSIDDVTVSESDGVAIFTVTLSAASADTVTVDYDSADGTAMEPGDYGAVSDTLTFASGETSKPVQVTIIDDAEGETAETFTVSLSNAVNANLDAASTGTATIDDNDGPPPLPCGLPAYNAGTERAVFIAQHCTTGDWLLRVTAGGSGVTFNGNVVSNQPFSSVEGFSIEANDTLDATTDPAAIVYALNVGGSGQDGFNFDFANGASVCVDVDTPAGVPVLVGANRTPAVVPFELTTLGPCMDVPPQLSIDDVSFPEGGGSAGFTVTLAPASDVTVTVHYASGDGTADSPEDYTAVAGDLEFLPGQTAKPVPVTIIDDDIEETAETFSVTLSDAVNATLAGSATGTGTIVDDDGPATPPCGLPSYDTGTERAIFIARDCTSDNWLLRATPGGSGVSFRGSMASEQPFDSVQGFSIEASDTLDSTTDPAVISYVLNVGGTGQDGFSFIPADGAAVCVRVDAPPATTVLVGANRTPATVPFDLETLGPCTF